MTITNITEIKVRFTTYDDDKVVVHTDGSHMGTYTSHEQAGEVLAEEFQRRALLQRMEMESANEVGFIAGHNTAQRAREARMAQPGVTIIVLPDDPNTR